MGVRRATGKPDPLRFFDRDDAARFLRRIAVEPGVRDNLARLADAVLVRSGLGAQDPISALAVCIARGTIVVTPIARTALVGLDGDREEREDPAPAVLVRPAESESKLWQGAIQTTPASRWKADLAVEPPPRWSGRITVRET